VLAWDAGKSEGHAVMVWIRVQNLPYCESRLTSYAGVTLLKHYQNYLNAGIAMELAEGTVGTCRLKDHDNF
jgi:hypothetical protein